MLPISNISGENNINNNQAKILIIFLTSLMKNYPFVTNFTGYFIQKFNNIRIV
jgi:hypothetical protein